MLDRGGILAPGIGVRRHGLLVLSAAIAFGVQLRYGGFLTANNLLTTLNGVSNLGIAGVGAAGLLIAGRVDLSLAGELALLSMLAGLAGEHIGSDALATAVAITVAVAGGWVLGMVNAVAVRKLRISPLIVTIATGSVYSGIALATTSGLPVTAIPHGLVVLGVNRVAGIPIPVVLACTAFIAGAIFLLMTVTGVRVFAIGGNEAAAVLSGVPVDKIVTRLFCLQGSLVGVVALIEIGQIGIASTTSSTDFEIQVLTAVLLGGVLFTGGGGRFLALASGVVTIGVVNSALVFMGVQAWWSEIVFGALLLGALATDQLAVARAERRVLRGTPGATVRQDNAHEDDADARLTAVSITDVAELSGGHGTETLRTELGGVEPAEPEPILRVRGIQLRYGAVHALRGVDLDAIGGEVTCLVGDNGAGKSSLIKVMAGVARPNAGEIELRGRTVAMGSPIDARLHGIETVYQDLAVCPNLNVAHNIVLGAEPRRTGLIRLRDDRQALREAKRRLELIGTTVTGYRRPVLWLSGGQRQAIAIARVLHDGVQVAIFDEPTASLGVAQTSRVLALIRAVARRGVAVVLVTHDIEAVLGVADRIVVMRLGRVVFSGLKSGLTEAELAQYMAGLSPERVRAGHRRSAQ